MSEISPRLDLPYLQANQAQKHVTHNDALQRLDALCQLTVKAFDATDPPALPEDGDCYALGAFPTGPWAGYARHLAYWQGTAWLFLNPQPGWRAWGAEDQRLRIWHGTDWADVVPDVVEQLGINTSADATNRLAVASAATLLSHTGAGHQVKINKAADTDTASLLFQSDWTGHAEMGLAGDTAFSIKTSADGSNWITAMTADPAAQEVTLSATAGAQAVLNSEAFDISVPITGSAVQSAALDPTPGRLMPVGAFGLGARAPEITDLNLTNNTIAPGFYFASSSAVGVPVTSGWYSVLHMRRAVGGGEVQLAFRQSVDEFYMRSRGTGAWTNWTLFYNQETAIGSVSETGGTPTGALVERGENANGHYVRFADGTQICWASLTTVASGPLTWTFPAAFSGTPGTDISPSASVVSNTVSRITSFADFTLNSLDIYTWTTAGAQTATPVRVTATGRWF